MAKQPLVATFQCLTCRNLVICTQCKGKHNKSHKMVPYISADDAENLKSEFGPNLSGVKISDLNCPEHRFQLYSKFCYTCNKSICELCTPSCEGHYMKNLDKVIEHAAKVKIDLMRSAEEQFEKIDNAIEYFTGMESLFLK